jgi:hypothetical protein
MFKMGLHNPFGYLKHATYHWNFLHKGYNFASELTSIEGLHTKLWASKVVGILILRISGLPTLESRDKITFGCWVVLRHKINYKGEGDGFPQV